MASVTWPPRVVAAPSSSSVKVVRARRGTASARRPTSMVRIGGTGTAVVVDIGRAGQGEGAVARLDTILNRWRPPRLAPCPRSRHAHAAERVPVNFSSIIEDNNFIGCGRGCIDFGQESPASTEGTITGNTFGPYRKAGVNVRWMKKSVITGNVFTKSQGADIKVISVPLSRMIIQNPNTTNQ